jgi:hypothetical protein
MSDQPAPKLQYVTQLGLVALILAWIFDQLFWKKAPGISFPIFVLLCLAGGMYLTWREGLRPKLASLLIVPVVIVFAILTILRQEPFTVFVDYLLTLGAMLVLALTWLGGRWLAYSLSDYFVQPLRLVGVALAGPVEVGRGRGTGDGGRETENGGQGAGNGGKKTSATRHVPQILLGLLLALPVVVVLASLLASADPVFAERLRLALRFFDLQRLAEYFWRFILILILAYLLAGVFIYALLNSRQEKLIGLEKPWLSPFLGWLSAVIVLISVDLLFLFFVIIQFQYFFGGQANINLEGFTYAEYARRGFGELVAVALISLLLFLGLSMITRRHQGQPRKIFSLSGIALVGLVAVILVSAFQRLLLYEAVYGFTRLRTYTHIYMIWLGVLLLATVLLELAGRMRGFALAAVLVSVGFGLTLNLLNVDAFVVRQNVGHVFQGTELDTGYLIELSDDSVPALVESFQNQALPQQERDSLGAVLACRAAQAQAQADSRPRPWPMFQWPSEQARRIYTQLQPALAVYPVRLADGMWQVTIGGIERPCWDVQSMD